MSIFETLAERTKGTSWGRVFLGVMMLTSVWTFTGPTIGWVVEAYADEKLDTMLKERGITEESFHAVQRKLNEVNIQTNGIKGDLTQLKAKLDEVVAEQKAVKDELTTTTSQTARDVGEVKASLHQIYNYLINREVQ